MDGASKTKPASIDAAGAAHGDYCFAKMDGDEFAAIVKLAVEEFLGLRGVTTLQISSARYSELGTSLLLTVGDAEFKLMVSKND